MTSDYLTRPVNRYRSDLLRRYSVKTYLDVGCGNGCYVREAIASSAGLAVGVDLASPEDINFCFSRASVLNLPFADNSFQLVSCFEVLEHINAYRSALSELARVSSRYVVITVPNCLVPEELLDSGLIFSHWIDPTHVNFFQADDLINMAEELRLDVCEIGEINPINTSGVVWSAFGWKTKKHGLARRLISKVIKKNFYMTLYAVFKIPDSL